MPRGIHAGHNAAFSNLSQPRHGRAHAPGRPQHAGAKPKIDAPQLGGRRAAAAVEGNRDRGRC